MANFTIASLRGGMNDNDPPIALDPDQTVLAQNVELRSSMLGTRRKGMTPIDLTGADIATDNRVTFLYRHLPTTNQADAQLWALGIEDGTPDVATLVYKDTAWHTVVPVDAIDLTRENDLAAQTLHGKMFLAYKSAQDRLHVWDGSSLRRTGLAAPAAAPTASNTGSGSLSGTRYYRVRFVVMSGTTVLRRSEPSDTLTFAPSGSGTGIVVTKPATGSEGETHWELEASIDNGNFYRIARTLVATTTVTDSTDYVTGYAESGTLSDTIGDHSLIPSCEFLTADQDRLICAGSFEDDELASRVMWTPVYNDPGVGNDERIPIETDNYLNLDGFEGGRITGMSAPVNGYIFVTKQYRTYKLVRTGLRSGAYEALLLSTERGAIKGSLVEGVDQVGRPCFYALDPAVGPIRIGSQGLQQCGGDMRETWNTVNLDATIPVRAIYYRRARQVIWNVATDDATVPSKAIVLHVGEMRDTESGAKRGWTVWTGPRTQILAACLFSENIDDDTDRSVHLKPFVATTSTAGGLIHLADEGDDDSGVEYEAIIRTKPYSLAGLINTFGVSYACLLAKAVTGGVLDVTIIQDFGLDEHNAEELSFTPTASEEHVIVKIDDLTFSELRVAQIEFSDPATPGPQWELNQFVLAQQTQQKAAH